MCLQTCHIGGNKALRAEQSPRHRMDQFVKVQALIGGVGT